MGRAFFMRNGEIMKIEVFNESDLPTCDFEEFIELQEDFKIEVPEKTLKLKNIIIERGFKYPFVCWLDPEDGKKDIIDAHRRKVGLDQLRAEGWKIPPVPYYKVKAGNKKEAVEEILLFNSKYSDVNPETQLFEMYDIAIEELPIDIPEIKIDTTGPKVNYQDPDEIKSGSVFGVLVACSSNQEQNTVFADLTEQGYACKKVES